jgi:EmrB/QacA subfamily drug resistance transporter
VNRAQRLVILGVMCSIFLASMEGTVVATAMPTIVGQLGGLASYSWVFAGYMLAATTPVPLFGKLSDLVGRRPVFAVAMTLFLVGSLLCAQATSMPALVAFRVVQGLGAGGILTLAFIIIGALLDLEQRARMTGLFASVWGVSSIIGPLLGGFIVDHLPWPWIFYINLAPGGFAFFLIWRFWAEDARLASGAGRPHIDYPGAALLSAAVVALLLGLSGLQAGTPGPLLLVAAAAFAGLLYVERRSPDPVLPLTLLRDRLFAAGSGFGVWAGWATFGSIAFVPLFVQIGLGTSATAAGATLMPLSLAWTCAAIVSTRLLLRVGYRTLALAGAISLTAGALLLVVASARPGQITLMAALALMGIGMGSATPAFLIAVQSSVPRAVLGTATSTMQFARTIGGAVGVGVMGAVLSARVASGAALAGAIPPVFGIALIAAVLGLITAALAPAGHVRQFAARRDAAAAADHAPTAPVVKTHPAP